ncbi:MAG: 16S rRNA m(2)G methyltransferase [Magnetococcales bacterium]|nr:16S rRNA m(2)G methyltransferase [Magnetococcales bacterium]HIJ84017.1 class I SAM-dependent methyltransferase [Magnetococcales bacterium]
MNPGSRSLERFFRALPDRLPAARLTHVHLVHQDPSLPSPMAALRQHGFGGRVVAARASIIRSLAPWPDMHWVLHDHPTAGQKGEHILLELPQGKEAARLAIHLALEMVAPSGRLWVYGIREHGIHSLGKKYPMAQVALLKGHMRLLSFDGGQEVTQSSTADPFYRMDYKGLVLATLPGVFSWRKPDEGSLLLLEAMLDTDPGERVLDWGCGYGLLGVVMARNWPQTRVVLADDQFSAIRCARETVRCNGLEERVSLVLEDGIGSELSKLSFNTIVTNPPFHRGARNEHGVVASFFHRVASVLKPKGWLWFVGNSFLEHGRTLQQCGFIVEKVIENNRFSVCRAQRAEASQYRYRNTF